MQHEFQIDGQSVTSYPINSLIMDQEITELMPKHFTLLTNNKHPNLNWF